MGCGCGGSSPQVAYTATGQPQPAGPVWRVVLPNGSAVAASSEWDAIQKQAMYGGAIHQVNPNG